MMIYRCNDGNCEVEIEAGSAREAAQEYVDGGDWGSEKETLWVSVNVEGDDGSTHRVKVQVDPDEPECEAGEHEWISPYSVLGGLEENPGVWGHGGGVVYTELCRHCGCGKHVDTWAQDLNDGEQGLTSVRYEEREFEEYLSSLEEE